MHYIVIDLEWNQCPEGNEKGNKKIPFEIVEIGAVKLDEDRNIVDKFSEIIKPQVYETLNKITEKLIKITEEELQTGAPFPVVMERFLQWCGQDVIYCTWGSLDLIELQRNMEYYELEPLADKTILYFNVQKLCCVVYKDIVEPKTLESMVDYMNLTKNKEFHRAISDATYTAEIFQKLNWEIIREYYSIDTYITPKSKKEEIYIVYRSHSKYITMEYSTKSELLKDKDVKLIKCCKCQKNAVRKLKWFSYNTKQYYGVGYCREHGYIKGKIHIKEKGETYYAIKTTKMIEKEEADKLYSKRDKLRIKRKEKRNKKKQEG